MDGCTGKTRYGLYSTTRSQLEKPTTVVMTGEKGASRSQAALAYCHQARDARQFQTVFWLNAESLEAPSLCLESAASVVRPSSSGPRCEKLRFLDNFLAERWHPWLLVLDKYGHEHFETEGLQVASLLPSTEYGAILIMTQNSAASGLGQSIEVKKYITAEEWKNFQRILTNAVKRPNIEKVRRVVFSGYDVNNVNLDGWPFVTRAALHGFTEVDELFLDSGADIDPKPQTDSLLQCAANTGALPVVKVLLDYEVISSIRLKIEKYDYAIKVALENGHLEVVQLPLA